MFILIVFCIQLVSGFNYFLFPVIIDRQGFSTSFIGMAMSCEVLAIALLCSHIPKVIKYLGTSRTIVFTSLVRLVVVLLMDVNEAGWGWVIGIFAYGASTSMLLVLLQTWLNLVKAGKLKGFIMGLYSSALSLGIAAGPVILQFFSADMHFNIASLTTLLPLSLLFIDKTYKPAIIATTGIRFQYVFDNAKIVMLSAFIGGICFFGLPSFLMLYGLSSGLTASEASFLLPMFMLGSICAGSLLSTMSGFVDRMALIYTCVFISVVCAVFLALAIYAHFQMAMALLFIWGGCMGGLYAVGLEFIGHTFRKEDQISANTAFVFMDASGGLLGLCVIGVCTDLIGSEGLTYPIVIASVSYMIFITQRLIFKVT